jgi:hypothetical protein
MKKVSKPTAHPLKSVIPRLDRGIHTSAFMAVSNLILSSLYSLLYSQKNESRL